MDKPLTPENRVPHRPFRHWIALAIYLALALVLTYPLVLQFGDHVPGTATWSMDEYGYVWNNWWFKHAVFDLGVNPFHTNFIFYPVGTSLVLYTFTLLHVLLGLPIQLAFGLIPASNAEVLFSFVVSGFGGYLLVAYLIRLVRQRSDDRLDRAAVVGGAVFAFASNRFVYASLGHYNVVGTEWMPLYILFLVKTLREKKWSNALLAGMFAAFALYVETTDGVLLGLFTLLFFLFEWRSIVQRAVLARMAVIGATAALLFAPLLVPTLGEILNSGYSLPGWGDAQKLVVDLFGFVTPTSLNPLTRNWTQELDLVRQGTSRFADVNTVFLGYATLLLAAVAAIRYWKNVRFWAASALVFAVLSLGPLLNIFGKSVFDLDGLQVTFPMPYLLLHYVPVLKEDRVPNRFSALIMLSLAVLVGFAVVWLADKVSVRSRVLGLALAPVILFLILFEHLSVPLPLTDARVPAVYSQIAQEPGNFAVLTLPLGWRNSFGQLGAEDTQVQYYQSVSQKYIFQANIQRNPPFLFDYFDRIPVFHSITQLELYNPISDETLASDRAFAPELMSFFDVRYVVIHPSIPGRPPYSDTRAATIDYVQKTLPLGDKIYDSDGVIAYRVNQPTLAAVQRVEFGTDTAHLYQAEGWDRDETILGATAAWADESTARLMFPIRQVSDYQVTLRALPFAYPNSPAQTMELVVGGESIAKYDLSAAWKDYSATIPARLLNEGLNDLYVKFGYLVRPRDVLTADYAIGKTGKSSPVDIVVNASGLGSIKVDGREASLLGRGYNVVQVDPKSGAVIGAKVFNTADDKSASRAMTDYLAQIPAGTIVAVASQESVAGSLGDRTVAGLQSLGASIDARQAPDNAHALIGIKGAPPSTAVEEFNPGSAFVSVGRSPDDRTLAAAVSELTIEKR